MPGVMVVRCAECGAGAPINEVKYVGGVAQVNHKMDCSQQYLARPFLYSQLQAETPQQA